MPKSSSAPASEDWYDSPKYYDMIFSLGTADEVAFLKAIQQRFGPPRGRRVLEPACGSGRLVVAMAQAGYKVRGFDISRPMLNYAREKLREKDLKAELVVDQMQDFKVTKPFHLAHCLVSTFKYLLTEQDAVAHLKNVAQALVPKGIYVLGFHLSDYEDTRSMRERWCAREGKTSVSCVIHSWPADKKSRRERVRSRMRIREGQKTRSMETLWDFRTYDTRQVKRMLAAVPEFEHIATYDFGFAMDEPRQLHDEQLDVVLILRKR